MSKNKNIIEVKGLSKSFNGKKVIDNVSFSVSKGDVFGFLGPNGAGKTTIIRMMLRLIHSDSGSVYLNGYDIKKDFEKGIKNVGAIVETPSFYSYLSAYDNLVQIANLHPEISKQRIHEVLEIVGLKERAKDVVKTYSLGMKQRLGLARTLLNKPSLVFLDEPTNGLDPQGMIEIRELISQLAVQENITFFITTHMLHEVEQICNRVAILQQGQIIALDSVQNLLNKDTEVIVVHTDEKKTGIAAIKGAPYISHMEEIPEGLRVELVKGASSQLTKELVNMGISIDYVVPQHQSLEQFFIELTGGNSNG